MIFERQGAQLAGLRTFCGLSVTDCSELFKVSERQWRRWESPEATAPIKDDILDWFQKRVEQIDEMCELLDEALDLEEGFADLDDEDVSDVVTYTVYRSDEALERVHPGFPGGAKAHAKIMHTHGAMTILKAGRIPQARWDDDFMTHVDYSEVDG